MFACSCSLYAFFQMDLSGVFQSISSSNEADGCTFRHEVNLPACPSTANTGISLHFISL